MKKIAIVGVMLLTSCTLFKENLKLTTEEQLKYRNAQLDLIVLQLQQNSWIQAKKRLDDSKTQLLNQKDAPKGMTDYLINEIGKTDSQVVEAARLVKIAQGVLDAVFEQIRQNHKCPNCVLSQDITTLVHPFPTAPQQTNVPAKK